MIPEKKNEEIKYCAITEQGDLGLGAEVFGASDQEVLKEQAKTEDKKK